MRIRSRFESSSEVKSGKLNYYKKLSYSIYHQIITAGSTVENILDKKSHLSPEKLIAPPLNMWYAHSVLVTGSLWRLAELDVVLQQHLTAQLLQDRLDGVVTVPPGQDRHGPGVHRSTGGNTVHVYSACKADGWWLFWVVIPALYPQGIHPVLECSSGRSNDHPCPAPQIDVVLVFQAPTDGPVPHPLLTRLQLLKETEAPWHDGPAGGAGHPISAV